MAALDFPASPSIDDLHTQNGQTWRFDGVGWVPINDAIPAGSDGYIQYKSGMGFGASDKLQFDGTSLIAPYVEASQDYTGATSRIGYNVAPLIQSGVTSNVTFFRTRPSTQAASFTLADLTHYSADFDTRGAGSTITNQYGFRVPSTMNSGNNNFAFHSALNSGSGTWAFYGAGTAPSYFNGSIGIGTTVLTGYSVRNGMQITGSTTSYGFAYSGEIQSGVTNAARVFSSIPTVADASFTLSALAHYHVGQGTFGVGATVTNQHGFQVTSGMTGATNNFAFRGELASATGVWNLFMSGTASNYLNGPIGISAITLTGFGIRVLLPATGAASYQSIGVGATVHTDVTSVYRCYQANPIVAASATLTLLNYYSTAQGTFNAGAAVTTQAGFYAHSSLVSATNNYGFFGVLADATGVWNLFMSGSAPNYLAGKLGVGATSLGAYSVRVALNATGATTYIGIGLTPTVQTDVTSEYRGYYTSIATVASVTLSSLIHYNAAQGSFGSGTAVTTQVGFAARNSLTGGTNNYGLYSELADATGRWNLYAAGTAANYMAGRLGIGSTVLTGYNLRIGLGITGAATSYGIAADGAIQSGVTSFAAYFFSQASTAAASFTLTNLHHFRATQATIGSGSAVTNQYGFSVANTLTGATNNFGFHADIASGSNRWQFYAAGTANSAFNGNVRFGGVTAPTVPVDVTGDILATGKIRSSADKVGYTTGAGGTVTQATSKSTGVTLNKPTGEVVTHNANLAAGAVVTFTLTNSFISATDALVLNHAAGGNLGDYVILGRCGSGSATIAIRNVSGGDLAEAITIRFAVIAGVTS